MRKFDRLSAGIAAVLITFGAGPALARGGQGQAPHPKLGLAAARAIALKVRPGTVTAQELERETGGSGLRYSFDIKVGPRTYEVGIDAMSSRLIENSAEGSKPD